MKQSEWFVEESIEWSSISSTGGFCLIQKSNPKINDALPANIAELMATALKIIKCEEIMLDAKSKSFKSSIPA